MQNTKFAKYTMVAVLLLASIGFTWMQLSSDEKDMVEVLMLARDIGKGEILAQKDFYLGKILRSSYPADMLLHTSEAEGKAALVNMSAHTLASKSMFGEPPRYEPKNGNALTSIKLLPDSAICWTSEIGEVVDVYYIEDKLEAEKLGSVIVKGKLDQRMGDDELYMFMIVEGSKKTVLDIVEKRANGRIEIVKQR